MIKKPLIIITGATSVGKTAISIELAKKIGGSVISADSMQVYKGFDIGTAKISKEEMQGVEHFLIDELEPDDAFNVFEFQSLAKKYIDKIYSQNKIPIIAGGTGFYIQSVLYDIDFSKDNSDKSYREYLEALAEEDNGSKLYAMLKERDPDAAMAIHPNNKKRVIRALEYLNNTGEKISSHNSMQKEKEPFFNCAYFVINALRRKIYDRIEQRADEMIRNGFVEEVRMLMDKGVSPDAPAMQGLGYKEIAAYLNGDIAFDEAARLLKKKTRHYAKRQITWFKREKDAVWLNKEDFSDDNAMLDEMLRILSDKRII